MTSVRLLRDGFDYTEIQLDQLTPATVATLYQLDITTVWLKEECGPKAFFPNPDCSDFSFTSEVGVSINSFLVKGMSACAVSGPSQSSVVTPSNTPAVTYKPLFTTKRSGCPSVNVKIVQAHFTKLANGKPEFTKIGQTFVDVTETNANVYFITDVIQRKWGREYVLVTADALKIEDSSGTQGLKFWKVGSRKIFAVPESEICGKGGKGKKRREVINLEISDCSDDEIEPTMKKTKLQQSALVAEVKGMRKDLDAILCVSKGMKLPPGLYQQLADTFKCQICLSTPMKPPVIFTRCCKNLLGCEKCVDEWFAGGQRNKSCPLCRAERAYSETCRLNGLDSFLLAIHPLVSSEDEAIAREDDDDDDDFLPTVRF